MKYLQIEHLAIDIKTFRLESTYLTEGLGRIIESSVLVIYRFTGLALLSGSEVVVFLFSRNYLVCIYN